MGGPVRRDEYWKYTNPASLVAEAPTPSPLVDRDGKEPVFASVDRLRLVFADGVFAPDRSDDLALEGISIEPLEDALATDIHWSRDLYGVLEERGQTPVPRPLAALNTAAARQGFVIRVTGTPSKPVSFHYVQEGETSDGMVHHVVRLEPGTEFTLLENGPAAARFSQCLEVDVAGTESVFKSFTLAVNGLLTRNEAVIELTGDDAQAHVAGAAAGDGKFHHDDTVFITHDAENCESRQVFKKVLRNGAVGAFQGKILVKEGAQRTDGYQISQGLLLDDDSQFLAKPELEIYADDVACSHGSTVGAVDEDAMFYLTSRGVPKPDAQDMLVLAFLDEAIQEIEDQALADEIRDRLGGWLSRHRSA